MQWISESLSQPSFALSGLVSSRVYPGLAALGCILCAEHVRQLGGESPLPNLVEVKG